MKGIEGLITRPVNQEIADRLSKLQVLDAPGVSGLLIWMEGLKVRFS